MVVDREGGKAALTQMLSISQLRFGSELNITFSRRKKATGIDGGAMRCLRVLAFAQAKANAAQTPNQA